MKTWKLNSAMLVGLAFYTLTAFSQEQLGLRLGGYSGINGTFLQPAQARDNHLDWEVNLIAAGLFVDQNYAYLDKTNVIDLARNTDNILAATEINEETQIYANTILFDYFNTKRKKYVNFYSFGTLPSVQIKRKKHSIGVFLRTRVGASANRISSNYNYYEIDALNPPEVLDARKFGFTAMAWSEVGVHYSRDVLNNGGEKLSVGANVRLLMGHEAIFIRNRTNSQVVANNALWSFDKAELIVGFTGAAGNSSSNIGINGYGASVDLGITYLLKERKSETSYRWKVGASLLDIGGIRFNKNAAFHEFKVDQPFEINTAELNDFDTAEEYVEQLNQEVFDGQRNSLVKRKFGVWTPTGFSLQAEKPLTRRLFVNAVWL